MAAVPARLSTADRAMLRARSVWGRSSDDRFFPRFEASWRERLQSAREAASDREADPRAVLAVLRAEHAAEARPNLARVHPSWWVRGLKDESPAVQRVVAAHARDEVAEVVRDGLHLTGDDLATSHPPHPEALRWALNLWIERLVGGPTERSEDPPVVVALSTLDRSTRFRLVTLIGLAKLAYALGSPEKEPALAGRTDLRPRDRDRVTHFRTVWKPFESRLVHLARLDLIAARGDGSKRIERLGLITIGRLLTDAEPHRVRWALQHLPYNLANFTRARISLVNAQVTGARLVAWEERMFQAARDRLQDEDRLRQAGEGSS